MARKKMTFEDGMRELEQLVNALERGEMSLEDSINSFEKAQELQKTLRGMLEEGSRRIRVLTENGEEDMGEAAE